MINHLHRPVAFASCICWAASAGASIAFFLANNAVLNSRSENQELHAMYIGAVAQVLGALFVLPRALFGEPWGQPKKWWSMCGGFFTVPSFFVILVLPLLGEQIPLLVMLCAQLAVTFVLDWLHGTVEICDPGRLLGLLILLSGIFLDAFAEPSTEDVADAQRAQYAKRGSQSLQSFLLCVTATAGAGFALQAKINSQLTHDVGHVSKTVVISHAVMSLVTIPACAVLWLCYGVEPVFLWPDWPRFVFAGLQSAFYTGSMSLLPELLGYTVAFMAVQAGNLACSTVLDASGATGKEVPLSFWKLLSLLFVACGLVVFARSKADASEAESRCFASAAEAGFGSSGTDKEAASSQVT